MSRRTKSDARRRRLEQDSPVAVGDLVADKYRVESLLASGGMGVVAAARHEVLEQRVAIKFLLPRMADAEQTAQRFLREAKAAARINSQHVVRVFDCGELDTGIPYMVMEHLSGLELSKAMSGRGPWPAEEAVEVVMGALEGIAQAHAMGIVHRDLKPSNLFLVEAPGGARIVKVLDFGISKIQPGVDDPVQDDLTETSMMLGSPRYIAPEQARNSRDVDARSDIWSLGVILYQMLDGQAPFNGDTIGELLSQILLHRPEPLHLRRDDVPEGLARVVERCLQRDNHERFADVGELARALVPFGGSQAESQAERIAAILAEQRDGKKSSSARETERRRAPPSDEVETKVTPTPSLDAEVARSVTQGTWAHTQVDAPRRQGRYLLAVGALLLLGAGLYAGWHWGAAAPPTGDSVPASEERVESAVAPPLPSETPTALGTLTTGTASTERADAPPPTATAAATTSGSTTATAPPANTRPPGPATTTKAPPPKAAPDDILKHSD